MLRWNIKYIIIPHAHRQQLITQNPLLGTATVKVLDLIALIYCFKEHLWHTLLATVAINKDGKIRQVQKKILNKPLSNEMQPYKINRKKLQTWTLVNFVGSIKLTHYEKRKWLDPKCQERAKNRYLVTNGKCRSVYMRYLRTNI